MDEEGRIVVVCDIGSEFISFGLAEDYSPIFKFPTAVGRPKNSAQVGEKINDIEIKELLVGDEVLQLETILDVSHPVKNGIVEDWSDLTSLLDHVFSSGKINMRPKRAKLFITESPMNPLENRVKLAKILFEKFSFHSIGFGNQAALALFSQGLTSGVVVQFHADFTDICPVNFYPINNLTKRVSAAENSNLSEIIFDVVQSADTKARVELYKRIILLGNSNSNAPTVENDIKNLYLEKVLENDEEKLKKFKLRVDQLPSDNDKAFTGGALVARMNKDKSEFWISKESFQENGATVFG